MRSRRPDHACRLKNMNCFTSLFFRYSFPTPHAADPRLTKLWAALALIAACGGSGCSNDADGGEGDGDGDGDSKGDEQADCKALCDRTLDCPMDPDPEDCLDTCETLAKACPNQAHTLVECSLARPDSDYECDESGETALKDGICEKETSGLFTCVLGGAGDTTDGDTSSDSTSGDESNASTDTDDTDMPADPGEQSGNAAFCQSACNEMAALGCEQSQAECEGECIAGFEAAADLECETALAALFECSLADVVANLECDDDGSAVAKQGVCAAEQLRIISCEFGDELSEDEIDAATVACVQHCESKAGDPPIECSAPTSCEATCIVSLAYLGTECGHLFIDYSACTAAADASDWACDEDGAPAYEGAACEDAELALFTCISAS